MEKRKWIRVTEWLDRDTFNKLLTLFRREKVFGKFRAKGKKVWISKVGDFDLFAIYVPSDNKKGHKLVSKYQALE